MAEQWDTKHSPFLSIYDAMVKTCWKFRIGLILMNVPKIAKIKHFSGKKCDWRQGTKGKQIIQFNGKFCTQQNIEISSLTWWNTKVISFGYFLLILLWKRSFKVTSWESQYIYIFCADNLKPAVRESGVTEHFQEAKMKLEQMTKYTFSHRVL